MRGRRANRLAVLALATACACTQSPEAAKRNLLQTGEKYFKAGKYKEASILYRKAIQKDRRFGEAYYRLALAELELGRVAEAVAALERATELEPRNEDAFGKLADLYLAIYFANPGVAKEVLEKIRQLADRAETSIPGSFDLLRVQGFLALNEKHYEAAVASFRKASAQRPDDGRAALGLAESLAAAGRSEEAERVARKFLETDPSFAGMYDFLYLRYYHEQRIEEAEQILQAKCSRNPSQIEFWLQLAAHYHATGDRSKMDEVIRRLLAAPAPPAEVYGGAGDFYMRVGRFHEAFEIYRRAAEAHPGARLDFEKRMVEALAFEGKSHEAVRLVERILDEHPKEHQARAMRGALRLRAGDPKELDAAIRDFEAALAGMPDNVVLRFNLAEAHLAAGNLERAIVEYQEAIRRRPDYLQPRYGLARAYMQQRNYAQVLAVAGEILGLRADDLRAKLIQSVAWLQLGKLDLAREGLEEVLRRAPQAGEAMFQLGTVNLLERKYEEAAQWFRRLEAAQPSDRRGVLGLAEVELARGRPEKSLELIQAQVDRQPDDLEWRRALGSLAARARRFERAAREFELVLAREPDDGPTHRRLAEVLMEQRRYAEARRHLERATTLMPEDATADLLLATALEAQGDQAGAADYYARTIDLAPDNVVALNNLAYILADTGGDLDRALSLAERARSRAPHHPDVADTLAWVYVKRNLNDSAIAILDDLVVKRPEKASWRYHLAVALYQKGDVRRARQQLEAALRSRPEPKDEVRIRELLAKLGG